MTQLPQEAIGVPTVDSHLKSTKEILGNTLAALDGDIGHIRDFYFDDNIWVIRYAIADTGPWLTGRLVLLSPHAFGRLDLNKKTLHINLRKMQIQDSPSIESHKPVSRQFEVEYYRYYGWPAYWAGDAMWGMGAFPVLVPPLTEEVDTQRIYYHRDDKHLHSAVEVIGYPIETVNGKIGHVTGFLVDDRSWAIRELVVEAGHWYSGKEIRIPIEKVDRISFKESKVIVSLTKADIEKTAEHGIVAPMGQANRAERDLHA
jgi:hypothetical protein